MNGTNHLSWEVAPDGSVDVWVWRPNPVARKVVPMGNPLLVLSARISRSGRVTIRDHSRRNYRAEARHYEALAGVVVAVAGRAEWLAALARLVKEVKDFWWRQEMAVYVLRRAELRP